MRVEESNRQSTKVYIDGKLSPDANTSLEAVKQVLLKTHLSFKIEVNHFCQVPVGAGYGASGAGALGVALALSKALGLRKSREELVAAAHVAEVIRYTGLGDVGAEALGGLVIGVEPGAPPHGKWKRIAVPSEIKLVCATLGPISTKDFLRDAEFKERAGELGRAAIGAILEKPDIQRFISISRDFAGKLGLLDDELKELIEAAEKAGAIGASQAMLGRSVFAFTSEKAVSSVADSFRDIIGPGPVMVAEVYGKGAETLDRSPGKSFHA